MNRIILRTITVLTALVLIGPAYPGGEAAAQEAAAGGEAKGASLNFVNVDISTVTKSISEITGKNFIFDEKLRGKITVIAPEGLGPEAAFNLFVSLLELKGMTAVPAGKDTYKIIMRIKARQHGIELSTEKPPVNESYIAQLIPLKHIDSKDAVDFLKPVVATDGHISAFQPGNLLLVVDSGINLKKIISIIKLIDLPLLNEEPELVILKHASAGEAAAIINEGASRILTKVPGKTVSARPRAVADQRLNAVVLFGVKAQRNSMKRLLALLDTPTEDAQGGINVYFLENADAEDLAKVLTGIVAGVKKASIRSKTKVPLKTLRKDISVTADKATNSLVIVASQSDYLSLLNVIKQLDRRTRQVMVEAMIIEASVDKLHELGAKWRVIARDGGEPVFVTGFGSLDSTSISSIISGLSGLTIGGMGNFFSIPVLQPDGTTSDITVPGFSALFRMNEFKDVINVLSTPQILTSDNKEATIMVGENVPFISRMESDPSRANSVFNTIERKDVGITLRLTPQITEGDYVKLDIYLEISAVKETPAGVSAETILTTVGPTTTKRSTETSIIIRDAQTVVIGGLIQEKSEETITKVPLLGDIPILGWLFKSRGVSKNKTNLIVFLTPYVVREDGELKKITETSSARYARKAGSHAPGELIVRFEDGVTPEEATAAIEEMGASVIRTMGAPGTYLVSIGRDASVTEAAEEFSIRPEVLYAEPNYVIMTGDER